MKVMTARFASKCPTCEMVIRKGDMIQYDRRTRKAYHNRPACVADVPEAADGVGDAFDMAWEDRCAAACGLGL